MDAIVFGNVTLDVICYPVNYVPRHESISFDQSIVSPGGCASNVAIGLASLGIPTSLIANMGDDDSAGLLEAYWQRTGVDTRFTQRLPQTQTGVSVGLVDDNFQPRFVHTSGANGHLSAEAIDPPALAEFGVRFLHVAGFFVLPSLLDARLAEKFALAKALGITTSLDVVFNVRMDDPQLRASLWQAMPHIDYFMCNAYEAFRMMGESEPKQAGRALKAQGATNVIVKLGEKGCWVEGDAFRGSIPTPEVEVVDTTGAGDAFAAGFIAALSRGADIQQACLAGNQAGGKICTQLGAITAWLK